MIYVAALIVLLYFLLPPMVGLSDLHFHRKPKSGKIRVACVGDSITNGALIPCPFLFSYPSKLQRMLGEAYHVENFGLNGRTLQTTADRPYILEEEYRRSLDFEPDIVVIMLGTNDTKLQNWVSEECFAAEYRKVLDKFATLEKTPRIILCTPPWQAEATNAVMRYTNNTFEAQLHPIRHVIIEYGKENSIPVVDLFPLFEQRKDLISYDGVHPNGKGAKLIAEKVSSEIK